MDPASCDADELDPLALARSQAARRRQRGPRRLRPADHAEELVKSIRQCISFECLVDEATRSASTGSTTAPGNKPIVRRPPRADE